MVEKCPNCGAVITGTDAFCPECGVKMPDEPITPAVETTTVSEVIPEPVISVPASDEVVNPELVETPTEAEAAPPKKPKKKVKWWMIALPVILAVAVAVAVFWQTLLVNLAPNLALANALRGTGNALVQRRGDTLSTVLEKADDGSGKSTVDMAMNFSAEELGDVHLAMTVRADSNAAQSFSTVGLDIAGQQMNFNLYADANIAAMNLDILTGETYLGLNYETFGADIRENEFLYELLGEDNIGTVESALDLLDNVMSASEAANLPEGEALPAEVYVDVLAEFFSDHKPDVASEELELEDENLDCYKLTYTISEAEFGGLLVQFIDAVAEDPAMERAYLTNVASSAALLGVDPDWDSFISDLRSDAAEIQEEGSGEIVVVFYLYDDQIAMVDMHYTSEGIGNDGTWDTQLIFGESAAEGDMILRVESGEDEEASFMELILTTDKDEEYTYEYLTVTTRDTNGDAELMIGYEWNRTSGELLIRLDSKGDGMDSVKVKLPCLLTQLENGYTLRIPDFASFVNELTGEALGENFTCDFTYTATAGAEISVPEYTDIAKLTENDILGFFMHLYDTWEL